jgi:hypothetical protein
MIVNFGRKSALGAAAPFGEETNVGTVAAGRIGLAVLKRLKPFEVKRSLQALARITSILRQPLSTASRSPRSPIAIASACPNMW